jgi:hypothetical protein
LVNIKALSLGARDKEQGKQGKVRPRRLGEEAQLTAPWKVIIQERKSTKRILKYQQSLQK